MESENFFWMVSNVEVRRPQDLAGLRLGTVSNLFEPFAKALDMVFTVVGRNDVYAALNQGMVDVFAFNISTFGHQHLHEVVPYVINHPFYHNSGVVIMDQDAWDQLPKHLQELVTSTFIESQPALGNAQDTVIAKTKKMSTDAGVEFINFSEEDAKWFLDLAYKSLSEMYIEKMPETAPVLLKMLGAIE